MAGGSFSPESARITLRPVGAPVSRHATPLEVWLGFCIRMNSVGYRELIHVMGAPQKKIDAKHPEIIAIFDFGLRGLANTFAPFVPRLEIVDF